MSKLSAWLQAARPLAQINIAVPLVFGQALAYRTFGIFRWDLALVIHAFGLLTQAFIVFANDAIDWPVDVTNTTFTPFSGGSRVVPEGKLTPRQLAIAAFSALLAMAAVSVYLVFVELRMFMLVVTAFVAALMWAYSFPPLRLSYRGHGELLQGLGLGIVLPFIGFYVQSNRIVSLPLKALLPAFLLGYAGNITTALPDTPSDRAGNKRSYPVRRGERAARRDSLVVLGLASVSAPIVVPDASTATWAALVGLPLAFVVANIRRVATADAENRRECIAFVMTNGAAINAALLGWTLALVF